VARWAVLVEVLRGATLARAALAASWLSTVAAWAKHAVRYLSLHTGIPALVVAAVLVAVGYRILKKGLRLAVEVAVVAMALFAMTAAGWIQW
jgi:hypothetical protein